MVLRPCMGWTRHVRFDHSALDRNDTAHGVQYGYAGRLMVRVVDFYGNTSIAGWTTPLTQRVEDEIREDSRMIPESSA